MTLKSIAKAVDIKLRFEFRPYCPMAKTRDIKNFDINDLPHMPAISKNEAQKWSKLTQNNDPALLVSIRDTLLMYVLVRNRPNLA